MPSSEETYRRQPVLHLIFAVSSIAMTLSIIWMIMADHLRPWKQVQREFHLFEREKLKADEQAALKSRAGKIQNQIDEFDKKIKEAEQGAAQRAADLNRLEKELKTLQARSEKLDTERKFKKAELDSLRSLYDGLIERGEEREARVYLNTTVSKAEERLGELSRELENAQAKQKAKEDEREKLRGYVDNLAKEREKLTREGDRVKRLLDQKEAQYFG